MPEMNTISYLPKVFSLLLDREAIRDLVQDIILVRRNLMLTNRSNKELIYIKTIIAVKYVVIGLLLMIPISIVHSVASETNGNQVQDIVQSGVIEKDVNYSLYVQLIPSDYQEKYLKRLKSKVDALKIENHLTSKAIKYFFVILLEQEIDFWQWPEVITELSERHGDILKQLKLLTFEDPQVMQYLEQIGHAIETGDYDQADRILHRVQNIVIQVVAEQNEQIYERGRVFAKMMAIRAQIANNKFDLKAASN
ncbi:MAG: hypothetical protein ACYSUS_06110, partial [Planctomycetota bacterium]